MIINGCVQCSAHYPHRLHILSDGSKVIAYDDHGLRVVLPTTNNHTCPLCGKEVTFIDPEFRNAFCSPCSWMGSIDD